MRRKTDPGTSAVAPATWRPTADFTALRRRASLARSVRAYFDAAEVLEVHTPTLMPSASPDPSLHHFVARPDAGDTGPCGYLQTSPEFAMKRLLAAGSGDIYHFGSAYRAEECGRHHLAEFTLIEWYRLGYDHHALMDDVERLLGSLLPTVTFTRRTYAELFMARYAVDPHTTSTGVLAACAREAGVELGTSADDRTAVLDALFAQLFLRTNNDREHGLFVYDFPVEQAAYARIDPGPPAVAQRFELVIGGMEIANGYFEVTGRDEQARRLDAENARRRSLGLPSVVPDPDLLAALDSGLPGCAGVALGFDRLVMLSTGADHIAEVTAFAGSRSVPDSETGDSDAFLASIK